MIASGMADFGYHSSDPMLSGAARDSQGAILPNKNFPDLKALKFAEWGFDFLKYFANREGGDFTLRPGSPANGINAGISR
jgi:hypothetical protein